MRKLLTTILALLIFFLVLCYAPISSVQANPDTYTFQPPTADNFLDQTGDYNYGGATFVQVYPYTGQHRRPVLKFDMSSQIPSGATIISATLSLYYYQAGGSPTGRTYWTYRITQTDWVEGTGTGDPQTGSSDWACRQHNTLLWTTAGGTYTTTNGSSTTVPSSFGWMNWNVKDQVQYAVNYVGRVAHFLIRDGTEDGQTDGCLFYSKESGSANKPKLYVEWTPPNAAPTNDQLSLDLTGASYKGTKTLLCGKQDYKFVYKCSDTNGVTDITYAQIQLDPSGKNVILRATRGSGDSWTFSEQSDPSNYVTLNTGGSSHSTSGNQKTFNFLVTINWAWGDGAETVTVRCYVIDSQSASDQDDYSNIFGVEAHLAFSSLSVNDYKVNPSQSLTFTWTKYYNGTSVTPPDGNYNDAVKLSGVTKGTDSSTVSGQCSVSFSAESSVNSYSYTVWASYNVSYGSFPAVIVNDLLAELSSVNGTSGTYQTLVVANFTWDYNNSAAHGITAYVWDGSICVGEATSNSTGFALLTLNQTLHGSGSLTVNGTDTDGIKVNSPLSLPYNITVSGLEVLPDAEYASGKSGSVIVNFKNVGELNATALKLENVSIRWKFLTATGTLVWSYMTGISDVNGNTWRNATYSILPAGFTVSAFYTFRTEIVQQGSEYVLATMDKSVYVSLTEEGVPVGPGGQLKLTIEPYAVDAPAGTSTVIELPINVEGAGTFEVLSVTTDLAWVQVGEPLPKKMSTLLSTGPLTIKLTATPTSEDVYKCRVTVKVKADSQEVTTSTYLTISTYAKAPIPSAAASTVILVGLAGLFGFLMLSGRRKRKGEY